MPTLTVARGLRLHYLDENRQAPRVVLLLHGLGANGTSWLPQVPTLVAAGYRVLAPDLRGFGRSSYPGRTGIAAMAHDAAALVRTVVGDVPVDVAGLSMGGTVALQLALNHARLVRTLVLVNSCARLRPRHLRGWLFYLARYLALYAMGREAQARLVARRTFPHPHQGQLRGLFAEQILEADSSAYRAALRALGCFNVVPRLAEVAAPTLVVTGEHDRTIPPDLQGEMAAAIPEARQVILSGAGHAAPVDRAEAFNAVFLAFLEQGLAAFPATEGNRFARARQLPYPEMARSE
jgi:pimeloyl-ACP methyl ester carboxylesterase